MICNGTEHFRRVFIDVSHPPRRDTCLALRFQTGSWMLFKNSRNSNKMAAFYTVHTSSTRIFNCLYFRDLKNLLTVAAIHFFSVTNWLYTTRQSDEGVQTSNWCLACFSIGSLSTGDGTGWQCWLSPTQPGKTLKCGHIYPLVTVMFMCFWFQLPGSI